MATIDVNLNVTVEVDDGIWWDILEYEDNLNDALYNIVSDLEMEGGTFSCGEWWVTGLASDPSFIQKPVEPVLKKSKKNKKKKAKR